MKVKPTDPNAVIRDPRTKARLPAEGMRVSNSLYWRRRIADKSVEVIDDPSAEAAAEAAAVPTPVPTGHEPVTPLTTRGGRPLPLPGLPPGPEGSERRGAALPDDDDEGAGR